MALDSIPKGQTIMGNIVYLGGLNTVGYKLVLFIHYSLSLSLSLSSQLLKRMWDEMKAGSERGHRAKMDMQLDNRSHHLLLHAPMYMYQGQIQVRVIIHVYIRGVVWVELTKYKYMAWV